MSRACPHLQNTSPINPAELCTQKKVNVVISLRIVAWNSKK